MALQRLRLQVAASPPAAFASTARLAEQHITSL